MNGFLQKGIAHEKYAELNEINWGKMEGKLLTPFAWIKLRKISSRWSEGFTDARIEGGESPEDVALRQKKILDLILSRPEEKNVLICMHGRAMRIFLCLIKSLPVRDMDRFHHTNLSLYLVRFNPENGQMEIILNNDTAHIKKASSKHKIG